jgi:hypothetical protein
VLVVPPSPLARKLLTGTRRRRAVEELVAGV